MLPLILTVLGVALVLWGVLMVAGATAGGLIPGIIIAVIGLLLIGYPHYPRRVL